MRDEKDRDDDASDHVADDELQDSEVLLVGESGQADDREGAGFGGDDRNRDRPPRNPVASKEVVFEIGSMAAKAQAKQRNCDEVRDDDGKIQRVEPHESLLVCGFRFQLSISTRHAARHESLRRLRAAAPASENSSGGSGLQHFHHNWLVLCLAVSIAGSSLSVLSQADPRQLAISLEQQGRNAEAEAAWQTVSKQVPSNPEPYAHLGLLEARQQHYPDAIGYYRGHWGLRRR